MKKIVWGVASLVLLLIAWLIFSGDESGEVKVLETAEVEQGEVREVLEATGIVKAQVGAMVRIGARATGVLVEVPVKVGDRVSAGQVVAVIDDRELQAKRAEAQARYNLAMARLTRADKDLARKQKLVKQQMDHQSSLDEATEGARVAWFEVEAAKASLKTLDIQISYTVITSPIDGVVSQVASQEGETVVSGLQVSNLVTVLDASRLEMWIYVDETDVGTVRQGQPVEFTVDAYPDKIFHGKVDRMYPEPEVRDNIVYYKALVGVGVDQADMLRPEMTTQCRVVIESRPNVISIPNTALKWVGGRQVVFMVDSSGDVREIVPELGLTGLLRSQVISGLEPGQKVATQLVLPQSGKRNGGK